MTNLYGFEYPDQLEHNKSGIQHELDRYKEVLMRQLSRARLQESDLKAIRRLLNSYRAEPRTAEEFERRLGLEHAMQNTYYQWKDLRDRWLHLLSVSENSSAYTLERDYEMEELVSSCRKLSEELTMLALRLQQLKRQVKAYAFPG